MSINKENQVRADAITQNYKSDYWHLFKNEYKGNFGISYSLQISANEILAEFMHSFVARVEAC